MNTTPLIQLIDADGLDQNLIRLADILFACVQDGASVGFITPFSISESRAFWTHKVRPALVSGRRQLFVAIDDDSISGTVQLDFDTFPNQRHRADVGKLLVDPGFRRRGTARALMIELEKSAAQIDRSLLTLDTITGSPAERLYRSLGYESAGEIPGYARHPHENSLEPTHYMYKHLT